MTTITRLFSLSCGLTLLLGACVDTDELPDGEPAALLDSAPIAELAADVPCEGEVHVTPEATLFELTAEEVQLAPAGYFGVAPLDSFDEGSCHVDDVAIHVATEVAPEAAVGSLCIDFAGGDEGITLRECFDGETPLAESGPSTIEAPNFDQTVGNCYFCTSDSCGSGQRRRKEGYIATCPWFPWTEQCCYAINSGCC